MSLQDYLLQLKLQRVEFKGIDAIKVPATATKEAFFITEVKITGVVKIEIEVGVKNDGCFMPLSTLSTKAKELLYAKLEDMVKKLKTKKQTINEK